MESADELMTPEDLAALLQIPLASLYAWRQKGSGPPGIKVGRHLRYRRKDVEDWLDSRSLGAGGAEVES